MPTMDDGPTDGPPRRSLRTVTVSLSHGEGIELLEALKDWAEEVAVGRPDAGWHAHITDGDGNELTIHISTES